MLNISNGVNLILDEHGRIQAEGLKSLPNDQAIEIRQLIKDNRGVIVEYLNLWNRAWALADYVDGGESIAPYAERAARMPELNRMVERMRSIENVLKTVKTPKNVHKKPLKPAV
nr:hypothetical protein [uncultured Desulfobacter sp.]